MKKLHPHYRRICATCKLEKKLSRVVSRIKNYFPKLLQKPQGNYPCITEIDNSNLAGATLLKSLSAVNILLQESRNIFSKKHLRNAVEATLYLLQCNNSTFKQPPKVFYKNNYS